MRDPSWVERLGLVIEIDNRYGCGVDSATLIRTARRRADLTQRELAKRAETSPAAICLYETGQRIPRVDTLGRVLAAAGSMLVLDFYEPAELDMATNAEVLVQVLDLAEELPFRTTAELQAPIFAAIAR